MISPRLPSWSIRGWVSLSLSKHTYISILSIYLQVCICLQEGICAWHVSIFVYVILNKHVYMCVCIYIHTFATDQFGIRPSKVLRFYRSNIGKWFNIILSKCWILYYYCVFSSCVASFVLTYTLWFPGVRMLHACVCVFHPPTPCVFSVSVCPCAHSHPHAVLSGHVDMLAQFVNKLPNFLGVTYPAPALWLPLTLTCQVEPRSW